MIIEITILILFIIGICYISSPEIHINPDYSKDVPYKIPTITIKTSTVGGRGVFASQSYSKGDIIEICPTILQKELDTGGPIDDYAYHYDSKYDLIAFGFCSIYNHKDDPNAKWYILNANQMKIKAVKPIQSGEEIFISYGSDYFKTRKYLKQNT